MPKTIVLRGDPVRKEREAAGTIKPGQLITLNSDGKVEVHGDDGGNAYPSFAVEQDFLGQNIDNEYSENDNTLYVTAYSGVEIYAMLDDSEDVDPGDLLQSAGNGNLKEYSAQAAASDGTLDSNEEIKVGRPVARALEAVTTTGDAKRIRVEVL